MNNMFDKLTKKFKEEENYTGEQLAGAVQEYLDKFTESLKQTILKEKNLTVKPVNKIYNILVDADDLNECVTKNMYSVLKNSDYSIVSKELGDNVLIEKLNSGISKAFAPKDEFDIIQSTRITLGHSFFEISNDEIDDIINKKNIMIVKDSNGVEYELTYYFCWSDFIVNKCREMWHLSRIYKDDTPILYMPYATKFFRIEVDIEPLLSIPNIKIDNVDLRYKENDIYKYSLLNKTLVWNVKEDIAGREIEPVVSPVGNVNHYKYSFKELLANQYIIPEFQTWPSYSIKIYNEKELEVDFENKTEGRFKKITIYNYDEKSFEDKKVYFSAYNALNLDYHPRLRSEADIIYEIKKFAVNNIVSKINIFMQKPSNKEPVLKYSSEMSIYKKGRFGYKNTNKVYIEFCGDKSSKEFIDYVNFVIDYLTYCYPEIGWEGVA